MDTEFRSWEHLETQIPTPTFGMTFSNSSRSRKGNDDLMEEFMKEIRGQGREGEETETNIYIYIYIYI